MTPQEAETQAREAIQSILVFGAKPQIVEKIANLIIQAGETEDARMIVRQCDAKINELCAEGEKVAQERDSLREKLELAIAVKHEALKAGVSAIDILMGDSDKDNDDSQEMQAMVAMNKALSTNPGQSLLDELAFYKRTTLLTGQARKIELDELKLAKEKAEALDWLQNGFHSVEFWITIAGERDLLAAITQARKEQEK